MKNIKILFLAVLLSVFITGCRNAETDKESAPIPERTGSQITGENLSKTVSVQDTKGDLKDLDLPQIKDQRMIIRTGTMNLEVEKFEEAERILTETVKRLGGYVANSSLNQYQNGKKYGTLVLKVPAVKFDELVSEAGKNGKVMSQNVASNDITEEFVDLESRLKTQKELEQRLIKILNEKASRLAEVIEVEEKLASVRQKIENIEGRMKLLKSQSDYSTLTVTISEQAFLETVSGGGFFHEILKAVKDGLKGFTSVLTVSITVLIAILPVIFFVLAVFWIIKRMLKKRKQLSGK
ncbi:MAG: DUF4349 domain-containing protein [Ignavibacteria bacterium]|nr:DUF4349 domain-containing protein [Ignavibacteria bacterium]